VIIVAEDARLVSTGEAAKIIGVTRRTLSEWARTGVLRPASVTPTGRYFWDPDELRRQFRERQRDQD